MTTQENTLYSSDLAAAAIAPVKSAQYLQCLADI
jgi:hypothetical protein